MAEEFPNADNENDEQEPSGHSGQYDGFNPAGMALGMGVGVALGAALGNMGVGIALGAGMGVAFSVAMARRNTKE